MDIKYPVRVSLTDETLILDRDNVEVATTFFGQEDYDAEYERRALDAAVIAECLNKRKSLNELEEAGLVAGEAYQVIGDLALAANLYDHPEVQRALDWFSGFEPGVTYKDDASILPWPREELKADGGLSVPDSVGRYEPELNEEALDAAIATFQDNWGRSITTQMEAAIKAYLLVAPPPSSKDKGSAI